MSRGRRCAGRVWVAKVPIRDTSVLPMRANGAALKRLWTVGKGTEKPICRYRGRRMPASGILSK